jgi:hypothetical protein
MTSVIPPGPYGTMTLTGRFGQSCAHAPTLPNIRAAQAMSTSAGSRAPIMRSMEVIE